MQKIPTLTLNNGVKIPQLGLGTWEVKGEDATQSVLAALAAGYRHIDTARIYGNEGEIGEAIKSSGIPRKDIFITTKLWNSDHQAVEKAFNASLQLLDVSYIDLYLIHFPVAQRIESWKVMEKLLKSEKCRSIGVSNFTKEHLQELMENTSVVPAVNQVEFTPYLYQKELLDFCTKKGIILEAYSPLTRGKKLNDPKLLALAKKYKKTPAQIMLRWDIQHGVIVLPKSKTSARIEENAKVFDFEISQEDMTALDSFNEDLRLCWDPTKSPLLFLAKSAVKSLLSRTKRI